MGKNKEDTEICKRGKEDVYRISNILLGQTIKINENHLDQQIHICITPKQLKELTEKKEVEISKIIKIEVQENEKM